jgi:hypothetical protein
MLLNVKAPRLADSMVAMEQIKLEEVPLSVPFSGCSEASDRFAKVTYAVSSSIRPRKRKKTAT